MQVSTDVGVRVEGVPGFVPRVLPQAEVGLFRAEDRVFDAMLHGWRADAGSGPGDRDDQGSLSRRASVSGVRRHVPMVVAAGRPCLTSDLDDPSLSGSDLW